MGKNYIVQRDDRGIAWGAVHCTLLTLLTAD